MNVPHFDDRPLGEIVQSMVANFQEIVRSEVRLAGLEMKREGTKAVRAAAFLVAGGTLALFAFGFLLWTAFYALSLVLDQWLAALIVAAVLTIGAAVFGSTGRKRWRAVHPAPERTIETVKENVQWVREQTRSNNISG